MFLSTRTFIYSVAALAVSSTALNGPSRRAPQQRVVILCNQVHQTGLCQEFQNFFNGTCMNLDATLSKKVASVQLDFTTHCNLFLNPNCADTTFMNVNQLVDDMSTIRWNNAVQSFRCFGSG